MYYISDCEGAGWGAAYRWEYRAEDWMYFETYEEAEKENKEQELHGNVEEC